MYGRITGHDTKTGDNVGREMPSNDLSPAHDQEVLLNPEFQTLAIEAL